MTDETTEENLTCNFCGYQARGVQKLKSLGIHMAKAHSVHHIKWKQKHTPPEESSSTESTPTDSTGGTQC